MVKSKLSSQLAVPFLGSRLDRNYYSRCWQVSEYSGYARGDVNWFKMTLLKHVPFCEFHLRPYRDEPSASRPIRADKHRRGQRVLTWVTSREHCAAAGFFFVSASSDHLYSHLVPRNPYRFEESCLASFFCPYTTPKGEKDAVQHLLRACGTFYSSTRIQMACNWDWDQCETYLMPRDEVGVSNPAVGTEMKCRANGSRPKKNWKFTSPRDSNPKTRTRGVIEQKRQNWTNSILRGSEWVCLPHGRRSNWRSGSRKHYDKLTARMRWHGVLSLVSRCDTNSTLLISSYHTDFIVSYSDFVIWGAEPESEGTRTARTHCLWQR